MTDELTEKMREADLAVSLIGDPYVICARVAAEHYEARIAELEALVAEREAVSHVSKLLTILEVQEILRCSKPKVYGLIHDGELTSIKVGRKRLIPSESVDQYLDENVDHDIVTAAAELNERAGAGGPVTDPAKEQP